MTKRQTLVAAILLGLAGVSQLVAATSDGAPADQATSERSSVRAEDARYLLELGDFVSVETFEETEAEMLAAGSDPKWAKSRYSVSFDDVASHKFFDLVEESVELVKQFPGVTDALHEDRELIVLLGDFDASALEDYLRDWWTSQLTSEA